MAHEDEDPAELIAISRALAEQSGEYEERAIVVALHRTQGVVGQAAALLGLKPGTLSRMIREGGKHPHLEQLAADLRSSWYKGGNPKLSK